MKARKKEEKDFLPRGTTGYIYIRIIQVVSCILFDRFSDCLICI